jgi:hypothetical protein
LIYNYLLICFVSKRMLKVYIRMSVLLALFAFDYLLIIYPEVEYVRNSKC